MTTTQLPLPENQEFIRVAKKFRKRNILKYIGITLGTAILAFGVWIGVYAIARPVPYQAGLVSVIDDGNTGFLKFGDRGFNGFISFSQFDTSGEEVTQVLYLYLWDTFWTRHFATDSGLRGGNLTWINIHNDVENWPIEIGGVTGEFYDGVQPPFSKVYYLNNPSARPRDVMASNLTAAQIQAMEPILIWER